MPLVAKTDAHLLLKIISELTYMSSVQPSELTCVVGTMLPHLVYIAVLLRPMQSAVISQTEQHGRLYVCKKVEEDSSYTITVTATNAAGSAPSYRVAIVTEEEGKQCTYVVIMQGCWNRGSHRGHGLP